MCSTFCTLLFLYITYVLTSIQMGFSAMSAVPETQMALCGSIGGSSSDFYNDLEVSLGKLDVSISTE